MHVDTGEKNHLAFQLFDLCASRFPFSSTHFSVFNLFWSLLSWAHSWFLEEKDITLMAHCPSTIIALEFGFHHYTLVHSCAVQSYLQVFIDELVEKMISLVLSVSPFQLVCLTPAATGQGPCCCLQQIGALLSAVPLPVTSFYFCAIKVTCLLLLLDLNGTF